MKPSGLSLSAIGFAILVIAIDFAVIRATFFRPGPGRWPEPGARLLPVMLLDPILATPPNGWVLFVFYLLPMIDALLIGLYRLRRRGHHTATAVARLIAGSTASLLVFTSCLISRGKVIGVFMPISRRIALAGSYGLARLFGVALPNLTLEWIYAVILAILFPIAFFCIPPLLVAIVGGRVARHLDVARPSIPGNPRGTELALEIGGGQS